MNQADTTPETIVAAMETASPKTRLLLGVLHGMMIDGERAIKEFQAGNHTPISGARWTAEPIKAEAAALFAQETASYFAYGEEGLQEGLQKMVRIAARYLLTNSLPMQVPDSIEGKEAYREGIARFLRRASDFVGPINIAELV